MHGKDRLLAHERQRFPFRAYSFRGMNVNVKGAETVQGSYDCILRPPGATGLGHGGRARRPPDGPDGLGARDAKSPGRVKRG